MLSECQVALLHGKAFGRSEDELSYRLSYTDFNGAEFFRNVTNYNSIDDDMIKKYAPNVVEGVSKLSNWAKNS